MQTPALMQTAAVPEKELQKYRSNILSTIGKTPLVKLSRLTKKWGFSFFGKMESLNPGGSIKERIYEFLVRWSVSW